MASQGLGITIRETGIALILNQFTLRVPLNQRSYAWEASHVKTLLTDFTNAVSSDARAYFLGTIVVSHAPDGALEVADGQQRLATTAILIAAIRDHLEAGSPNEKRTATKYEHGYLLEFNERSSEFIPKLTLNAEDNDYFVTHVLCPPGHERRDKTSAHTESHLLIEAARTECAAHVAKIIAPYAVADRSQKLYDWIEFLRTGALVILIGVPDQFNAYTLFETLNDRGLRASQADILKNYLFGQAQDRLREVAPKWTGMTAIVESIEADDLLLTYLRHYWISYNGPTLEKELAEKIRNKVRGKTASVDEISAMHRDSFDYAGLFSPLEHGGWQPMPRKTRAYIYVITRVLKVEQIRPLLLAIIRKFNPAEALKALRMLLSWSVRFLIAGGGGGGVLDSAYGSRAKEISDGDFATAGGLSSRMQTVVRTDAEFLDGFRIARVTKKDLARYYLRSIELQMCSEPDADLGGVLDDDVTKFNLEHILPVTPSAAWGIDLVTANAYAKRIGNLTLLDPASNVRIGNKGFAEKRTSYTVSPLAMTKGIEAFGDGSSWGPNEIEARQQELGQWAVKVWTM